MARLVCESGSLAGREWKIDPGLTLGREGHNQIPMPDNKKASRDHAKVWRESPGRYSVADLGSTNGTLVNDGKIARQVLVDGDEITVGEVKFRFVLDDEDRPKRATAPKPEAAVPKGAPGTAGGAAEAGARIEVKSRVLQYQKKGAKGGMATWDLSQSSGGTKWIPILLAIAIAGGLFWLVMHLVS